MRKARAALLTAALFLLSCSKEPAKEAQAPGAEKFTSKIETPAQPQTPPQKTARDMDTRTDERPRGLKIGVLAPLSGEESAIGAETVLGVKLALEAFNASGGIDGKPIDAAFADAKANPEAIRDELAGFMNWGAAAVIGAPTGWSTFTPVFMANEGRTVFISAGTRRHIGSSGPFIFRMSLPSDKAAEELIGYCMDKEGLKSFFLVTVMEDESLNTGSAFMRATQKKGATIKAQGSVFNDADLPEAIKALKAVGPVDAILYTGGPTGALKFIELAKKNGVNLPLIGSEDLFSPELLSKGGLAQGTIVYSGFSPDDTDAAAKGFIEAYRKKTGKAPGIFAADAYDAFMIIADSIKKAGTSPEALRKALSTQKDFPGVTGRITIGPEREAQRPPYILKVSKDGGAYGFHIVRGPH